MWDPLSNTNFLFDTGAEVSILPATVSQKLLPPTLNLYEVNGSATPVYKRITLGLNLNLQGIFQWTFYAAAVSQAIHGAD